MSRLRPLLAAGVVAATLLTPLAQGSAAADDANGSFTEHTFAATATTPARNYWLYLAPGSTGEPRPLVVFLHGCNETALQAARATHFNPLASEQGFDVVYPEQYVNTASSAPIGDGNGIGCWNWFLPADQAR